MRVGKRVLGFTLHRSVVPFVGGTITLSWNVEAGLGLRVSIHLFERLADGVEVQEFEVVQAVVKSVVLVKVTAHQVGNMNEARMNEGPGGVVEDDRLEFRNRKKETELNEMRNKFEPAENGFKHRTK